MELTVALKDWAVENCGLDASSSDEEFQKAIASAMVKGTLTTAKFVELSTDEEDRESASLSKDLREWMKKSDERHSALEESIKTLAEKKPETTPEMKEPETTPEVKTPTPKPKHKPSSMEKLFVRYGGGMDVDGDDLSEAKEFDVRVKAAIDSYDDTKSALLYPEQVSSHKGGGVKNHPKAGMPVKNYSEGGRQLYSPSEKDLAICGVFGKYMVNVAWKGSKAAAFAQLNDHDKQVFLHTMTQEKWCGSMNGDSTAEIQDRKLTSIEQKALIDDGTSGGLEAAPIVFDDRVIQAPLLYGELFPLVNVMDVPRGRRIEGVATGKVTASWGGVDASAISLFSTTSYVSAFDTTIFRWEGAIQIGLDFLSDTPIDFGNHITEQYGERLLEDLDDVIAAGNGTTQPEGVVNKTGATSVSFGGATSLGNYESLRFGVPKNEHRSNLASSIVFIGTETSYQRARAIPVGASDARRLGGMSYDSYRWMERDFKINESLTNQQIMYAVMARYRMYRRRGFFMRTSTEGDTLIRNNELLMVAMARYGGQMERGAVIAKTTDAPA